MQRLRHSLPRLALLHRQSLAGRLFLSAILLSLFVLIVAGTILSTINSRTVEAAFDERLKLYLKVLVADVAALNEGGNVEPGNLGEPQFQIPLSGWYWQIVRVERENENIGVLRASRSLFGQRLAALVDPASSSPRGDFRDGYVKGPEGRLIRIVEQAIDLGEGNRFIISVAGNAEEISDERQRFDLTLVIILTLLASALAFSAFLQVRYGLKPLRELSASLASVRAGERDHVTGEFPSEVAPLARELNQVLDINREITTRARRQVGNLAHALKTPLSVLLNEAANERTTLSDMVREQTAIMRDQVQYYLDRARAAARAATIGNVTEVEPVIESFVRIFEKICQDRGIAFLSRIQTSLRFRGEKQDLEEMIGNLVDNAGKWAQTQVKITVITGDTLADGVPAIEIHVDDDGSGLNAEARQEVTQRGRRLDETKPGSGLGLSIVVDLAALYGGSLVLSESPEGGLRARLILPGL